MNSRVMIASKNLNTKSNFISILFNHKNINRIVRADEVDFYNMIGLSTSHNEDFENHWPYIIQATRNSGFVYKENETRVYFYIRDVCNELVVVNFFGIEKFKVLSELKTLAFENNMSFCIKNIPIQQIAFWNNLGYCEKEIAWNAYSSKDDNTFPECIYDLQSIAEAHLPVEPGHIRGCRASHARKLRKFLRERDIQIKEYDPKLHKDVIYNLLVKNAEFLEQKGVDSKKNVIDAHMFIFNNNLLHKRRLLHIENGNILGFYYITIVNDMIFANALIHVISSDLMRFLVWQGLNYLYNQLDKNKKYYVDLQGSENSGQYNWKKGFSSPIKEMLKTHITCKYNSLGAMGSNHASWLKDKQEVEVEHKNQILL